MKTQREKNAVIERGNANAERRTEARSHGRDDGQDLNATPRKKQTREKTTGALCGALVM